MNPPIQGEDAARLTRQGADQAIQLALESKWEEAAALNRSIIAVQANDVDAWNRLGKALLELGRYRDAHEAYGKSLAIDPINSIAKRNLDRLSTLQDTEAPRRGEAVAKVAQDLFIEEIGKSGVTVLQGTTAEALLKMTAGDEVYLKPDSALIHVENVQGETLGNLEPKLALRLRRLIEGGNRYAAAIKSLGDRDVELIIKEIYRDPSQTRVSFPSVGAEGVRPYIKESLLRLAADDDDDEIDDDTDTDDWSDNTETDASENTVSFSTFQNSMDAVDDEEEEDDG